MLNHEYFTPNEVSKVTSVSTRTLRYYHEIGLLVPSYIDANGYRYYHSQDITKLQTILFLRQLNLSLENIQDYFQQSITDKNAILEENYAQIIHQRNHLNQIIDYLNHHLINHRNEEINMDKFNQFDVNEQYDKEAALKYGDTDYYQSYKDNRTQFNDSEKQDNDDHTNQQFNDFFNLMNQFLEEGYSANEAHVNQHIADLKNILRTQVPNADNQFLEYMALTYENDERFAKNINKNRNDHLNQYIARAIRAYIK
ncbi:MerR family transcriptional regulator [Staphylococcus haemolyticus]|uniref:MerR family transcriptional regulator n=1 Tax=Staphylococcus haemolyticus TaxID=1283 RepID=A0AB38PCL9_STAHA|nr:MerR family transcriptional regulator [Staphylococcus haemolyticus]MCE4962709.1 MerR family transcriptional regulator [Staphylococcus haemolyticus]MCE4987855.1 MerR family transcriptional regulator [Staphylococcus haemolyticus]MCE4991262.1 MerR family transcriptional regulator [Staphylococcus haemolyticus]MCE5035638.1 MerR family transcriptional regulator [Staphylococcus haemolyticus]MWF63014.1 MerR family transcriptional regulator [Staphylococcus haemolyticus]